MNIKIQYFFILTFFLNSCKSKTKLFERISSSESNIHFANTITLSDSLNVLKFEYLYNGAGVGVGDMNGDGYSDIFFAGNQVSSKFYLNKGPLTPSGGIKFEDVTEISKVGTKAWCTGVAIVDINQDKKLDIYVSTIFPKLNKSTPNLLFINQGNDENGVPIFKEMAKEIGLADESYGTQASFFDFDLDGDLDVYLATNAIETYNRNNNIGQRNDGGGKSVDKLYRNEGVGKNGLPFFKEISKEAGILSDGWGLGIIVNDINRDGYPDVYVGNDFMSNDLMYINNRNGTFTNKISEYLPHQSLNSMGLDMADINNDGLNDLMVVDMLPDDNLRQKTMFGNIDYDKFQENIRKNYQPQYIRNVLQLNNGNNTFSDIGYLAGVAATDWSWSPLMADFDNDGLREILVTNGYRMDVTDLDFIVYRGDEDVFGEKKEKEKKMAEAFKKLAGVKKKNFLFKNRGDLQFENVAEQFGLEENSYTNGTAYADFDNDGDLDLVMNNIDDEAFIYKNTINDQKTDDAKKHFLRLQLEGSKPNWEGYGAKITIFYAGQRQYAEHQTVRGYKSSMENYIHFGFGNFNKIDSLKIVWPSGKMQVLNNITLDKTLILKEINAKEIFNYSEKINEKIFEETAQKHGIEFISEENDYNDFSIQHTLPHKHSELGTDIAVGDINGDGLSDFFVTGNSHKKGAFFVQNKNSSFTKKEFIEKIEEDTGALLIDVDNDKDLDLYCVRGSSEFSNKTIRYQDQLFLNNGKGDFSLSSGQLPTITSSGKSIAAIDYDKDGDLDLFRGGRVSSMAYPSTPESYLLENNGKGIFKNISSIAAELANIGMVTDAIWSDYNGDTWPDLVLVGEFMPITIFKNNKGKSFTKINTPDFKNTEGWWNCIKSGDFDKDGDIDYILGNLGLNSKLKASVNEPVTLYAKDFDTNEIMDPLLTSYNYGKEYLVHPRGVLIDQLIAMRRRFKTFKEYGETTFENAIPEVDLQGATILKANMFESIYLENKGNDKFQIKKLPIQAQFAPLNGFICQDFNKDGNLDLITVGNNYSTEVLTGRYDAGIGNYLEGDGKGNFKNISVTKSGFFVNGDAKCINKITLANKSTLLLVSQNNAKLLAFKQN